MTLNPPPITLSGALSLVPSLTALFFSLCLPLPEPRWPTEEHPMEGE